MANPYEYIVFEPDQVLTNEHLNETFNYLDQQNRWTRNKLIGIGIVCGLDIIQHTGVIEITKGCGVTSQGYLILQDTAQYAYYILYAAPDQPNDLPFTFPGDLPFYKPYCQNKTIYLLLTDDQYNALDTEQQKSAQTLSSARTGFLDDYVIVLFLEARETDLKNCDMFDCNNKGEKMGFAVRPLLVAKKDLPNAVKDSRGGTLTTSAQVNIPHEIQLKRFNVPFSTLKTANDIISAFTKLVDDFTLSRVANAYIFSYEQYKLVLNEPVNPFTNLFNQLKSQRDFILKSIPVFIQYFYDFVDDLIKAYYEFRVKMYGLISACCPDENLFPLHLVLGEASTNTITVVHDAYRQYFIYSPLFARVNGEVTEAIFLFQRMKIMVREFTIPLQNSFTEATIKITPSQYEYPWLSQRAIPYYYRVNETGSELYKAWSYYKTIHGNAAFNQSYNANLYNSNDAVIHPLLYDIEHYNFFRIEGHIGKNYRDVLNNLVAQIQNFNLPVDIVVVQAGGDENNISATNPECSFQDLDSLFNVIRSELYCLLGKLMCYAAKQTYAPPLVFTHFPPFDIGNIGTINTAKEFTGETKISGAAETAGAASTAGTASTTGASSIASTAISSAALSSSLLSSSLINISLLKFFIYQKGTFLKQQSCFNSLAENSVGKFYASHIPSGTYFFSSFDPANLSNNFLTVVDLIEEVISTLFFATLSSLNVDTFSQKMSSLQNYLLELCNVFLQFEVNQKKENLFTDFEENMDLFNEVIDSCFADEFTTLKNEYNARVTRLKQQMLFSNYFIQHKGMEHKAGVPKGGTFIIVYNPPPPPQTDNTRVSSITNLSAFTNISNISKVSATVQPKTTTAQPQLTTTELAERLHSSFSDVIARDPDFLNRVISVLGPSLSAVASSPFSDNEVIADFYIPYKCCSDCSPVAYVLPEKEPPPPDKPTIDMQTSFCDNDKTAYPIKVSQPGGTFADANGNKIQGLNEATLTFTPTAAGAGTYTIIYTLNGIASNPKTVTVLKTPASSEFKFEAKRSEENRLVFETKFFPAIEDDTFSHKWTFGPGFSPQQSADVSPTITATVPVTGGEIKTFASLTVSNGNCSATEVKKELLISPNGVSLITTSGIVERGISGNVSPAKETKETESKKKPRRKK